MIASRLGAVADLGVHLLAELSAVHRMGGAALALRYATALALGLPRVVQTRTLRPADEAMADRVWHLRAGPRRVALEGRWFGGAREIFGRAVYAPDPTFAIRPGERVVDLGANVGLFTLMAAAQGATVLAVEAQSGFVPEIRHNLALNGLADRVWVATALVGAGRGVFATPEAVLAGSHGHEVPPVVALEALLDMYGFARVDLLKVDIEGSEFALFGGGDLPWLTRVRRIAMEVHPPHGDVADLVATLRARGFEVRVTDARGRADVPPDARGGYVYAWRVAGAAVGPRAERSREARNQATRK